MPAVRPSHLATGSRVFRASRSVRLTALAAGVLSLAACQPVQDPGSGQPAGPMYSCIGEAGYSQSWDEIMAEFERHPPDCGSREPALESPAVTAMLKHEPGPLRDSVRIHTYVMDGQCRFLWDAQYVAPLLEGGSSPIPVLPYMDPAGNSLPSGEYYVNTELAYPDGEKDTTYHKYGILRNPCVP